MCEKINKGDLTVREAGRLGGKKVIEKYGREFLGKIGKIGGSKTSDKYGSDYYATIGKLGGDANAERHDQEHFKAIGKKGGQRVKFLVQKAKEMEELENDDTSL